MRALPLRILNFLLLLVPLLLLLLLFLLQRWLRVVATLDAYFARSSTSPDVDGALTDVPVSLLLPALQFFCNDEEGIAARCCCCSECLGFSSTNSSSSDTSSNKSAQAQCWQRSSKTWRECLYRVLPRHELHNDLCEIVCHTIPHDPTIPHPSPRDPTRSHSIPAQTGQGRGAKQRDRPRTTHDPTLSSTIPRRLQTIL